MTRPNILIIYTDQQRHDTIGALTNPNLCTPNMNRLVKTGMSFTQAFTPSPVCMAARWSLHSGQWTTTHQCYSNHHPGVEQVYSMPGLLREAGYRTALIGKNHSYLSAAELDHYCVAPECINAADQSAREAFFKEVNASGCPRLGREPVPGPEADMDYCKTDEALRFMSGQAGNDVSRDVEKPFFMWLSYIHPHTPYFVSDPWYSMYEGEPLGPVQREMGHDLRAANKPFRHQFHQANNDAIRPFNDEEVADMRRVYCGQVSMVDAQIGRVLDALQRSGQLDHTLIVFMSDHGDYMGDHGLITKSPSLYDCLVRTPFIVCGPGVKQGEVSDALVSHVDVLPTVLTTAGVKVPEAAQGEDLTGVLSGEREHVRDVVFAEYGVPGEPYDEAQLERKGIKAGDYYRKPHNPVPWEGNPISLSGRIRMARTQDWKLVEEMGGTHELYDLVNDPHELVNLYGVSAHAEVQRKLHRALDDFKAGLPGIELG